MLTIRTNSRDSQTLADSVRSLAHDAFATLRNPVGFELRDILRRIALLQRDLEESGRSATELSRWLSSLKRQVRSVLEVTPDPDDSSEWVIPSASPGRRFETVGPRS